jgi:hypothetical protein
MKHSEPLELLIKCDGERSFAKAILISTVFFIAVAFLFKGSPSISELRHTYYKFLTPIVFLISAYYWQCYFREIKQTLRINEHCICWDNSGEVYSIKWLKIKSITVVDMSEVGEHGIAYVFSVIGLSDALSTIPSICITDYDIEPTHLLSIVNKLAEKNNFSVIFRN